MYVELHDGLKNAQKLSATRVVVYDAHGNPIAVVVEVDGGQYVAATAANKQFQTILKTLGIDKSIIVDNIDTRMLKPLL